MPAISRSPRPRPKAKPKPKLNVYIGDDVDLLKQIKALDLPVSQICRNALWAAVEQASDRSCKKCKAPAKFHVIKENGGDTYSCAEHVPVYIGDQATVRTL